MVRKLKLIPKDKIVEMVHFSDGNYSNMARNYIGSRNDIRPSLNYWTESGVLHVEQINKQSMEWSVISYDIDDMEQVLLNSQYQNTIQLDNSLAKLSGKKIITKSNELVKSDMIKSDYWKMIFSFQNISEFYIKLLLQREKENNKEKKIFLSQMIRHTMKTIRKTRKQLIQGRTIHEITYLEKALDSIPVFDTQFP
jgi:23S rRNA U2552 (ribose-2'-O)-methylase RlmE/FtsJ